MTLQTVSIIVPAYNASSTIGETLKSLLAQTFAAWEAIVVDDGSSDGTGAIAREFASRDDRIRVVSQANGGESAARNTGIEQARFEWLLFLDADDWIAPQYLDHMTAALAANPTLDAVHCLSVRVAADGARVVDPYEPPAGDLFSTFAKRAAFPVHACLVRRSLVDAVGRFDTSLRKSPDWDLWQRIARTGARFGAVREVLAYYRMQPQSASLDALQLFRDGLRVLKQGHRPDPRVAKPAHEHAAGESPEGVVDQQFYLLSWCAGLLIGQKRGALELFSMIDDSQNPTLYPNAIAQCLFESATLPTCRTREAWESLWPDFRGDVEEFLRALELQARAPGLAAAAVIELKRMILRASATWGEFVEAVERTAAEQRATLDRLERTAAEQRATLDRLEQTIRSLERTTDRLEQEKLTLEASRAQQQIRAETAEQERTELERQLWVRMGRRLKTLKTAPAARPNPDSRT